MRAAASTIASKVAPERSCRGRFRNFVGALARAARRAIEREFTGAPHGRLWEAMTRPLASPALALALGLVACGDAPPPAPAAPPGEALALADGVRRLDLRFPCGDATCAGWLFLPAGERPSAVVMAHGFAGTRDLALPRFAERFAREGLAAFVFDYRGFGASGGSPRQLVDPWRQLEDWRAALAFVRARADLDPERVALFGSSLGAGHALVTAADDGRVRAVVAQAPLVDTGVEGEATFFGFGWLVRLLLTAWADVARTGFGGESILIPAIAPAGGFGMIVDDGAYAAFEKLIGPGSTYRNAVVAHSVFTFDDYDPAPRAAEIRAPILLVAARGDRFAPFSAVESFAARAPAASVETIDGDHFDVYSPPLADAVAALEAAFLARHLR
jgi:pimeloyl-ACP methyl ester carboxylesterase